MSAGFSRKISAAYLGSARLSVAVSKAVAVAVFFRRKHLSADLAHPRLDSRVRRDMLLEVFRINE